MDFTRAELAVGLIAGVLIGRCAVPAPQSSRINDSIELEKDKVVNKVRNASCDRPVSVSTSDSSLLRV